MATNGKTSKPAKNGAERTLANRTYNRLREDIVYGKLAAGSKLKLETLIAEYAIGMSPLREALSRLVGDHLVVTEGQRGFWVAPLSLEDLDDVTVVRGFVETQALALSIQKGGPEWEARVEKAYEELSAVEESLPEDASELSPELSRDWEDKNREFHAALVSACGSPWMMRLRDMLYQQSERYRRVSLAQSRGHRDVHDEHRTIYVAAVQRNTLKACNTVELHLQKTADEVRLSAESAPDRISVKRDEGAPA